MQTEVQKMASGKIFHDYIPALGVGGGGGSGGYALLEGGDLGKQAGMSEQAQLLFFTKPILVAGVFARENIA